MCWMERNGTHGLSWESVKCCRNMHFSCPLLFSHRNQGNQEHQHLWQVNYRWAILMFNSFKLNFQNLDGKKSWCYLGKVVLAMLSPIQRKKAQKIVENDIDIIDPWWPTLLAVSPADTSPNPPMVIWLVVFLPPLWKRLEFVNWDDDSNPIFLYISEKMPKNGHQLPPSRSDEWHPDPQTSKLLGSWWIHQVHHATSQTPPSQSMGVHGRCHGSEKISYSNHSFLLGGFFTTPLKKIRVRQLGWGQKPNSHGKIKNGNH